MRKLYIHIGAHKAGSTSLQQALTSNSYKLRTNGVRYVNTGRQHIIGPHHHLTSAVRAYPAKASLSLFQKLASEIRDSDQHSFVISAEGLEGLGNPQFLDPFIALKEDLNLELVILFFVRRHVEQLNSAYAEQVRELHLDNLFNDYLQTRIKLYNRRYKRCVDIWSTIADRMIVTEFSASNMENLIRDEFGTSIKLGHANRAINPLAIEALRRFRLSLLKTKGADAILRRDDQRAIDAICARASEFDLEYGRFWGFSTVQYDLVTRRCREDTEFLKASFGISFEGATNREKSIIAPPYSAADKKLLDYVLRG